MLLGIAQDTNLHVHVHGLHVSPRGDQDNCHPHDPPPWSFDYYYRVPLDQDLGTYWYLPHEHMFVSSQIFARLAPPLP